MNAALHLMVSPPLICAKRQLLSVCSKTLHFTSRRERLWFGSGTKMGDQIVEPFPGREMCNFCSERPTTQLYACKNFLIPRTKIRDSCCNQASLTMSALSSTF